MKKPKITVIGAGNVGSTTAMRLAESGLGDVVLVDVVEGMPQGKALDLYQAAPVVHHDSILVGTNDYGPTEGSDIVVMTAGLARKPGMSRDDLQDANAKIVAECMSRVAKTSRDAIVIMVTNPLDVMCEVARRVTGFPRERVIGMAGILDTARMRAFIAMEMGVSTESVFAIVLGGHGDSMVPLPRYTTVSGVPLPELLPKEKIDAIVQRTAQGGGEIVKLLKTGSAYYAPAAGVWEMVDSIVRDRKKILPCSVYLQGEFGLKDVWVGVPCKLGASGMEGVFELKLTQEELALLHKSAADVKNQMNKLPADFGV
ncbi:malate dehydrogenase [Thermoanaerobaculum aquaticum]|uniref:Malate dehydrogenase n=1 Tax=Thermoanaerobaculum aquaticum TaxID=1312852 RepID=A0A062XUL8_9BACT|nr:malate dehydrogenase [Thermoanaerobaculum aquaticum]KDA54538.1 malate dehydrogenase [Thermoanaerobaculum aquaticum]